MNNKKKLYLSIMGGAIIYLALSPTKEPTISQKAEVSKEVTQVTLKDTYRPSSSSVSTEPSKASPNLRKEVTHKVTDGAPKAHMHPQLRIFHALEQDVVLKEFYNLTREKTLLTNDEKNRIKELLADPFLHSKYAGLLMDHNPDALGQYAPERRMIAVDFLERALKHDPTSNDINYLIFETIKKPFKGQLLPLELRRIIAVEKIELMSILIKNDPSHIKRIRASIPNDYQPLLEKALL